MRSIVTLLSFLALATATLGVATASDASAACDLPDRTVVTYWSGAGASFPDMRCDWIPSKNCRLRGYLYSQPTGNRPAVVFVHGADEVLRQQAICNWVKRFHDEGYVVFVPLLRGVGDRVDAGDEPTAGSGFLNSGINQLDVIDPYSGDDRAEAAIDYLYEEIDDVQAALGFLENRTLASGQRLVNPGRIGLFGHSYGGSLVTFGGAGHFDPAPRAVVNFSGAALSWGSSDLWRDSLKLAAMFQFQPIMFLMTISESPTGTYASTTVPYQAAGAAGVSARAHLYGAVPDSEMQNCDPDDSIFKCAHGRFFLRSSQVDRWFPAVLDFLRDNGV
jgi:dienelactone hydrolase